MSLLTAILIIFAVNFGFVAGAWWATRRREAWLKQHQPPHEALWGSTDYYDRLEMRFRAGGAL